MVGIIIALWPVKWATVLKGWNFNLTPTEARPALVVSVFVNWKALDTPLNDKSEELPEDLKYNQLSSELTVPKNLYDLASQNQIGLVMLKIVEIIGEDNISDLDPETIYFLNKILNELNLKKIRNNILSAALPIRV